ncbi:uncharacterized protein LOC132287081 isoform X2 [Cornus florida]|uniref:uncharacterized protein LOC132287081 isoform X2 n=1 Tax=Cornus florida TaxID=4283 RepID=UPI0028971687|nr:uncharacterized protein LOC132287081 isoform X2 [Cornus florida]
MESQKGEKNKGFRPSRRGAIKSNMIESVFRAMKKNFGGGKDVTKHFGGGTDVTKHFGGGTDETSDALDTAVKFIREDEEPGKDIEIASELPKAISVSQRDDQLGKGKEIASELPKGKGKEIASELPKAISASRSAFTSSPEREYEVCLSFRSLDTPYTLTDYLYEDLINVRVNTFFLEDNNLWKRGEINPRQLKAIMESKISIPIFSENYASSEWCLRELAQMVECRRTKGQVIIPIFYDVEPSDVKHQTGSYEEAFREHERYFDERTVKQWRAALAEVGALEGWEVKEKTDGYLGRLRKEKIVPAVLLGLKKKTDILVGMDLHEYEMMRLLDIGCNDVRIVGIHGMGGIGKTTIALFLYNKLLKCFDCGSFLEQVQEKEPVSLQKKLLDDTLKWCPDIADTDSGINKIKERLSTKKVLIVLDDLDERLKFDMLVGNCNCFGPGSRIIVTTRDKSVLYLLGVTYRPRELDMDQSLELFNMHAFRREFPPPDYYSLSQVIAYRSAGLPLNLVVAGSFLSDKSKVVWEHTLTNLDALLHDSSDDCYSYHYNMLRISYDALNYEQQQIFLDIACLFVGMDKTYAFYMWDDCGYHPKEEIDVLRLMSLVELGDDNVLRMHDLIRDLGREIVRRARELGDGSVLRMHDLLRDLGREIGSQENVMDLGKLSRLWNHEEALAVLLKQMGTEKVEALCLHSVEMVRESYFTNEEFTRLVNLSCPPHFKPTNFHLENLVILDLSHSGITEDWEGWNQIKMAKKLKVLDLSCCALTRTPDFSTYATLERLIIRFCKNLIEIDPSICHLKNLKVLDISGSFSITKLPDKIWMLDKLEVVGEYVYDVFLSFRGQDTFTDFLYHDFNSLRVSTFRYDNELCTGEEMRPGLLKAIKASKISIPIFSKNYASSKWCLRELAQIVECKRVTKQMILPIFYDVEPSDVQYQSGSFEEAFKEHEMCFSDGTVKEWKEALRELGALKGWEVKTEMDEYQWKLIKEMIVSAVLLELKKKSVDVPDYLVGIDHQLNEMMRLLNVFPNEVQIVGIYGIGGIGKTTIAKLIYDALKENFDCHSFLADIRETAQEFYGLVDLQKKLLTDTLKWCPDISDVEGGMDVIKTIFRRKKVLLVLDDVIESSQFCWLVGKHDWFGSGSRIIVTSKDRNVLNDIKVDATYEPPLMDSEQSLQLFSMHAFRRKFPPIDYYSISREVAFVAAGIPLTLEVIGSFLSNKEKVVWNDTLKKLKTISHGEVERKLRVSYEALSYAQQQIFLDIACLFTGMDKTTVFYLWDDCGYHPEKEFNVLCLMSLVKVERDTNELRMHDQFRNLGRKIVFEEKNLGNRSRLWNHEDALDVLEERRGTEKIEALSLCFELGSGKKPRFTSKEFAKLISLRYLRADGIELVGDFEHLFPCLRWLSWRGCPPHFKPTNFHLKNLVILDLSDSGITEDWGGWNQMKMENKLKVLRLADCALRRTPDLSSYATLEILILRHCRSLVEIDRSVGNLKNLKVLDISFTDIRKLPDEIWMLEKLKVIGFKR